MSKVQEALKTSEKLFESLLQCEEVSADSVNKAFALCKSALAALDKYEPVGELILDPAFLPALKSPLVNWKINLVDLEVGTKFFTSPQPREGWVLTPNKITDEMEDCWRGYYDGSFDADECYEKMLTKIPTDTKE